MDRTRRSGFRGYLLAVMTVVGAYASIAIPGIGRGLSSLVFVAVFLSARFGGLGPGLLATGLLLALGAQAQRSSREGVTAAGALSLSTFGAIGVGICLLVRARDRGRAEADEAVRLASGLAAEQRATLESVDAGVVVVDASGRISALNPVAEAMTGWPAGEARDLPFAEVLRIADERSLAATENPVAALLGGGQWSGDPGSTSLLARDGARRAIRLKASPIEGRGGGRVGVVLVLRDVEESRAAEKKAADAESRFRAFVDQSPTVAFTKDEMGRYLWGNAAWARQFEGTPDLPAKPTDFDLWPAETARAIRAGDKRAIESGRTLETVETTVGADGSPRQWMTLRFLVGESGGRPLLGGIALDITERLDADRVLRESEARYRMLFESNPQPMWVFDTETLRFLAVNDAAIRSYGYSRDEFLSMTIADIRPPDQAAKLRRRVDRIATTPFLGESHWQHRKKDGSAIEVEIASHSIPFEGRSARLVLSTDVTSRRRAEEASKIDRERLDLAIQGAMLGLWYCDIPGGEISLNERGSQHLGLGEPSALSIDGLLGRLHPDDRDPTRAAITASVDRGRPFDVEFRVPLEGGPTRWVRAIGRTFGDHPGRPRRFDGITIDVTGQKEAEAALRAAKEAAVEANRAKDRFLAVLGHELRTPLTPVLASVSALLDDPGRPGIDDPVSIRETFSMIRRNIELETRLIGDLLDVSRVERGQLRLEPERVDLHEAIRQSIEICRDAIMLSGLDVRLELDAVDPIIWADHARLMQIVWNLVHNSAKFNRAGGGLTIRTYHPESPESPGPGRPIVAEFQDGGVGIAAELLPRIFDPFEQGGSRPSGRLGGLGLGLSISRSLAEAHGGRLTATSPGPGLGATFRLDLRTIERAATPGPGGPAGRPESGPTAGASLLLVEDNSETLRYLTLLLRHRGYEVEAASGVDDAMDKMSSSSFDVLISDIELRDGSGLDLMRSLRGRLAGIAVSGFGSESDVQLSLDAGFNTHLTKPINLDQLQDAIRDVMAVSSH